MNLCIANLQEIILMYSEKSEMCRCILLNDRVQTFAELWDSFWKSRIIVVPWMVLQFLTCWSLTVPLLHFQFIHFNHVIYMTYMKDVNNYLAVKCIYVVITLICMLKSRRCCEIVIISVPT